MKAKVVNRFYGIAEDKQFEAGDEFEGTKERIEAINEALPGFLEPVTVAKKAPAKKEA